MTVIVLTKEKNTYHIHSDGRTSQDWMGISTNNSKKVHDGKDCIFGVCGSAAAKLIIKDVLSKVNNPIQVLRKLHSKDYKDLLQDSQTLVATKKHGCYTLSISTKSLFSTSPNISIVTWDDDALPQIVGSGFLSVRTLLSTQEKITPKIVEWAITQAYEVNHTIGGKISHLSLELPKERKKK